MLTNFISIAYTNKHTQMTSVHDFSILYNFISITNKHISFYPHYLQALFNIYVQVIPCVVISKLSLNCCKVPEFVCKY